MLPRFGLLKLCSIKNVIKETDMYNSGVRNFGKNFADLSKVDSSSNKQVMVQGPADDAVLRVRRAGPADIPRVIRFVKDNARLAWPGLVTQTSTSNHVVMSDYVARTLAQGHSMLAEQQEAKLGWSRIRGVALNTSVCPWDATVLEKWSKCIRCVKSRKLMMFTAHCLRAPGLHDKYNVQNILQVILMVPPDVPRAAEVVYMLAKNSILRGRDLSFSMLRFDVSEEPVAKVLDNLQLKKEYEFNYEVLPSAIKIYKIESNTDEESDNEKVEPRGKSIAIFTAFPHAEK